MAGGQWRVLAHLPEGFRSRVGRAQPSPGRRALWSWRSGGGEWVGACLFVQWLWRQVDAVGPDEGPCFGVDHDLGQVGRVVERFQDACPMLS